MGRETETPHGSAAILVNNAGQNEIIVALAANDRLAKTDLPLKAIAQARVVITQLEANLTASTHALKLGRAAGALTILNPALPGRVQADDAPTRRYSDSQ